MALQGYLQFAPMDSAPAQPYAGGAEDVSGGGVRGQTLDYVIMVGYFVAILVVGTWFSRRQKTTKDFFFGGQRFSWWLIAVSLIATTVGSYSFVKYSSKGFGYGLSSSQTYSMTGSGFRCSSLDGCRSFIFLVSPRCRNISGDGSARKCASG